MMPFTRSHISDMISQHCCSCDQGLRKRLLRGLHRHLRHFPRAARAKASHQARVNLPMYPRGRMLGSPKSSYLMAAVSSCVSIFRVAVVIAQIASLLTTVPTRHQMARHAAKHTVLSNIRRFPTDISNPRRS